MIRLRYMSKANRDDAARKLTDQGYRVRKSSARNVLLSPHYVADTGETDQGIYNSTRFFAAIYTVETV